MPSFTLQFGDAAAGEARLAGGKGVNLSHLTKAGFPVPPGYIVTTEAYAEFIAANKLTPKITKLLAGIDYDDADGVEAATAKIRNLIHKADLPDATARQIASSYKALGKNPFVAVRSSGTAEDLAGASFAGQHDTYLDIRGTDAVADAVKRCWASLWTARAVAYRQRGGFAHADVGIAVVVQTMIESEVSGVMFTANPMTAAVDEYVVNASWGLGEAIVAGIVTPDLFVVNRDDRKVRSATLGAKQVKIVRDPALSHGTREEHVPTADQARFCLTDAQVSELASMGARVAEYYDDYPQDIEWAFAGGQFYLLQSRDVTGVELSWDEDLDNFQTLPKDDETIWTRAWSDAVWTGAITPLMYSFRAENSQLNRTHFSAIWGVDWGAERRVYKYHKAHVYYNSKSDYTGLSAMIHPSMRREELLEMMPPAWRKKIRDEPFSWKKFLGIWARIAVLDPRHLPWKCWDHNYRIIETESESAHGLPEIEIRRLSDRALKKYTQERMMAEPIYFQHYLGLFYLHLPIAMGYFHYIVQKWCDEPDPSVVGDLLSGSPYQSVTVIENLRLQELAQEISSSPLLKALFEKRPGAEFFAEIEKQPAARSFHDKYLKLISDFGHRGHADRDILFERWAEDPGIVYGALKPLIGVDFTASEEKAKAVFAKRKQVTERLIAKLKSLPFGDLRAQAFVSLQDWLLRFWAFRDDERAHADKITFSVKKATREIGRRLVERGLLDQPDDFYFLGKHELFELLETGRSTRLVKAKIAGRRRNHGRFRTEFTGPMYMAGDQYADLETEMDQGDNPNVLRGIGTSRGKITARARVIASQKDIGQVKKGEILITAATDPGWTPVFLVISGLVLETGGMLAHGSLISREYGIPAVQIPGAMRKIPDGAMISVNGDTGVVQILDEEGNALPEVA